MRHSQEQFWPDDLLQQTPDLNPRPVAIASESSRVLSECGDEAALLTARMEVLEVLDTRPLDVHSYVVL